MRYNEYLKQLEIDGELFFPEDEYDITDEVNMNYESDKQAIIVNEFGGQVTETGTIQPFQLRILTTDIESMKDKLNIFIDSQNLHKGLYEDTFLQEYYSTPTLTETFSDIHINYTSEFIITGTLIMSTDIQDIKEVYIDNSLVETSVRTLTYATELENSSQGNAMLNTTKIKRANLRLDITAINKGTSYLSMITKQIRLGNTPIDKKYAIKLIYIDDSVEEYSMKLTNFNLNSNNDTLPGLPITFML